MTTTTTPPARVQLPTTWVSSAMGDLSLTVGFPGGVAVGDLLLLQCVGVPSQWGGNSPVSWGSFPVTDGWSVVRIGDNSPNGVHIEVWSKIATADDLAVGTVTFSHGTVSSANLSGVGTFNLQGSTWALHSPAVVSTSVTSQGNAGADASTGPIVLAGDPDVDRWILGIALWSPTNSVTSRITEPQENPGSNFTQDYEIAPNGLYTVAHAVDNCSGLMDVVGSGAITFGLTASSWWVFVGVRVSSLPPPPPIPPILDMAASPTKLYVAALDGGAWCWTQGGRTQLYIDPDGRQLAAGMVAVATAGEAAFFCDWKYQLWATGDVYVQNDVTGDWTPQSIFGYLVKVPIKADQITLMGPHGIGPSYQNPAALWVNNQRNLIGIGESDNAELEDGLLPSYPNPITQPTGGGFSWQAPADGSAVPVFQPAFDYRQYIWRALATSNYGGYAYFGAKVGGPIRPQGHMIG